MKFVSCSRSPQQVFQENEQIMGFGPIFWTPRSIRGALQMRVG